MTDGSGPAGGRAGPDPESDPEGGRTADLIDVWLIPTDQPESVTEALWGVLDPDERARAASPDPGFGGRFTVVHGAVRQLLGARLGCRPADLVRHQGPHGKPELTAGPGASSGSVSLNYSASGALAVLALARGRAIGVDVEEVRDTRTATRLAGRYFPAGEAAAVAADARPAERFTELWCRREACVKAYGGRLVQGFGLPMAGPAPLLLADPGALGPGPCRIDDVPVPGPFRAAVAAVGARPIRVAVRAWSADMPAPAMN
ncbi:4'-phosphopantetheinyl transferase family protein [Kitasatospora sp. NPDC058406]|uniref:4'-phosphopantetheinyl transferase family protein n=1 Tax=Kitasatospora sp. NPDC058406 TaxID=3346483 RepID=UPI00365899D4